MGFMTPMKKIIFYSSVVDIRNESLPLLSLKIAIYIYYWWTIEKEKVPAKFTSKFRDEECRLSDPSDKASEFFKKVWPSNNPTETIIGLCECPTVNKVITIIVN